MPRTARWSASVVGPSELAIVDKSSFPLDLTGDRVAFWGSCSKRMAAILTPNSNR